MSVALCDASGEDRDEEDRGDHQALQAGRREGGAHGYRHHRHDRVRGAWLWPPEGAHGALPGRRIHRGFPPQDQGRGRRAGPFRRQGRRRGGGGGEDRQHRRRQDLRDAGGDRHSYSDRRAGSVGAVKDTRRRRVNRLALAVMTLLVLALAASAALAQQPATPAGGAAPTASAPAPSKIDKGDTAWMLTASALVLLMTAPGLALFYGGMVRQKNALATLMQSFIILAVISLQWVLWGYSLAFGPDRGG